MLDFLARLTWDVADSWSAVLQFAYQRQRPIPSALDAIA